MPYSKGVGFFIYKEKKMSTVKLLGRETKKQLVDKLQNASTYQFKYAISNDEIDVNNLMDKSVLLPLNNRMTYKDTDFEWDSLVVELGHDDATINEQVEAILESYNKPNFTWEKDPGGGRAIQKNHVRGERPVIYDLHKDELGYHLHMKVFRYAYDLKEGYVVSAPNEVPKVADAQMAYTNKVLQDRGLPLVGDNFNAYSGGNVKVSQETQIEVAKVITNQVPIEEVLNKITTSTTTDEQLIDKSIKEDEKELREMLDAIKKKQAAINDKMQAKDILAENKQLLYVVKTQKEATEKFNAEVDQFTEALGKLDEYHLPLDADNSFFGKQVQALNAFLESERQKHEAAAQAQQKLSNEVHSITEKHNELKANYESMELQVDDLQQEIILTKQIGEEEKVKAINDLKAEHSKVIDSQNELIQIVKENNNSLKATNENLTVANNGLKANNEALNIQVSEANKKLAEEKTARVNAEEATKKANEALEQARKDAEVAQKARADMEAEMQALRIKAEQEKADLAMKLKAQEETNAKLAEENKNSKEENSLLKEFAKMMETKLQQASKLLSSLSKKLAAGVEKTAANEVVSSAKDFRNAMDKVDKDSTAKQEAIEALRAKFQAGKTPQKKQDEDTNTPGANGPKKPGIK